MIMQSYLELAVLIAISSFHTLIHALPLSSHTKL